MSIQLRYCKRQGEASDDGSYETHEPKRAPSRQELSGVEVLFQLSVKEGKPRASSIVRSVQALRRAGLTLLGSLKGRVCQKPGSL